MPKLLVKLIRLLANLSISTEVGPALAELQGVAVLVPLLELASRRPEQEELLLNAVSAITNLSFYYQQDQGLDGNFGDRHAHSLLSDHSRLCSSLVEILLHENDEAVTEAARAFGNLSRDTDVCELLQSVLYMFTCFRCDVTYIIFIRFLFLLYWLIVD